MPPKRKTDTEEPSAKRAKAAPAMRASETELEGELNTLIQSAKDGEFDKVFEILDKYPPYVNERPEERMYSTIHQAAYWGDMAAIKKLVEKYNADVLSSTKDGKTALEVAKENGHDAVAKYLEAKEAKLKEPAKSSATSGGRDENRSRIKTTRNDGRNEEADMELEGVKQVTLKLGAEGGGILCGAALVYGSGDKHQKSVCFSDRKFKTAINHSGDSKEGGRSVHIIKIDLPKMPKDAKKVYLTLCSCGPADLSKFKKPSIELLGDEKEMIRYDLTDAGKSKSTVMAVLENSGSSWVTSPVGAVSPAKFCGNYNMAKTLITADEAGGSSASGGTKKAAAKRKAGSGGGDKSLAGKTVVFTGKLSMPRAAAKAKAISAGATVTSAVSGNTDVVVYGSDAGSKLGEAEGFGCELWTEEEFSGCVG